MIKRTIDWVSDALFEGGFGIMGAGMLVVLYQIFYYLKEGDWLTISVIDALIYVQKDPWPWLLYPGDWVGFHNLLQKTPLSVGLAVLGIAWLFSFAHLQETLDEYQRGRKGAAEEKRQREAKEKTAIGNDVEQ